MPAPMPPWTGGRMVAASHTEYVDAQRAVDYLSDQHFPVEHSAIVGTDLKLVESVSGRMNYGKAALSGLFSGLWFGLLIGLIFGIFTVAPGAWISAIIGGLVLGAVFGAIFGLVAHATTGGRRDFASVSQLVAGRYDVMVDTEYAEQARQLLHGEPYPSEPSPERSTENPPG